jgi:type VI secretion system secreted protein VgrG
MGELMAIAQAHRRIAISTPLGKDVLLLRGFSGSEAISQLFHFDLDLLSENDSIKFQDVVGKNVTLRIYDATGAERHWNGFISRFSQGAQDRRLTAYRAQMVPYLRLPDLSEPEGSRHHPKDFQGSRFFRFQTASVR